MAGSASSSSSRRVLIASWSQRDSERKNCSRWAAGCCAPRIGRAPADNVVQARQATCLRRSARRNSGATRSFNDHHSAVHASASVPGYEDVAELRRGGFGQVVLADGMPVAVKCLAARLVADPGFRADFQQEARMLARLESAHTVRLYEYVETGGEPTAGAAIVMDVPGASLRKLLA